MSVSDEHYLSNLWGQIIHLKHLFSGEVLHVECLLGTVHQLELIGHLLSQSTASTSGGAAVANVSGSRAGEDFRCCDVYR